MRNSLNTGVLRGTLNAFSKLATVLLAIYGKHMLVTPLKQPYMYSPKVLQDFQVQPLAEKRNVFLFFLHSNI